MVLQPPAKADSSPLVKELLLVLLVEWRDDASSDCRWRELQLPADKEIESGFRLLMLGKVTVSKCSSGPCMGEERLLRWLLLESWSGTVSRSISEYSLCTRSGSLVFSNDCAVRSKRNASWDNFSGGTSSGSERACLGRRLKQNKTTAYVFLFT